MPVLLVEPSLAAIAEICRRFHARKLSIFGSAARGDMNERSDVDLLVEFDLVHMPGYFELVDMSDALSPIFGGRQIDLVTRGAMSPLIYKYAANDLRTLYEE